MNKENGISTRSYLLMKESCTGEAYMSKYNYKTLLQVYLLRGEKQSKCLPIFPNFR